MSEEVNFPNPEQNPGWQQHTPESFAARQQHYPEMAVHPRAYCPWNAQEDKDLLESEADGLSVRQLASCHGRQRSAIKSRLAKLRPQSATERSGATDSEPPTAEKVARPNSATSDGARPGWHGHDARSRAAAQSRGPELLAAHPRAYCRWSHAEDEQLLEEYEHGAAFEVMSEFHERQPAAVRSRLRRLVGKRLGSGTFRELVAAHGSAGLEDHSPDVLQTLRLHLPERMAAPRAWVPWASREDHLLRILAGDGVSDAEMAEVLARPADEVTARRLLLQARPTEEADRDGAVWTAEEDSALSDLADHGFSAKGMGKWLGRSASAVVARLVVLRWTGSDSAVVRAALQAVRPVLSPDAADETADATQISAENGALPAPEHVEPFDFGVIVQPNVQCPSPTCQEPIELDVVARTDAGTTYICEICAATWTRALVRRCPSCNTRATPHSEDKWQNHNFDPFRGFMEQRSESKDWELHGRRLWWCESCRKSFG